MYEPQRLRVQCVTGHDFEAIVYELFVFGEHRSFYDAVAAIGIIVEQGCPVCCICTLIW